MNVSSNSWEDYENLADALLVIGAQMTPAYIHGTMMGVLCTERDTPQNCWQALETEIPFIKSEHQAAHGLFRSLYSQTVADLHDIECRLVLMLPSDDVPLNQRLEAVVQWCEGYLHGIKLASTPKEELLKLPLVKEVLTDLVEIQDVSFDEPESDENEKAYMEIVEFVRVGVLLIHAECVGIKPPVTMSQEEEQTVH